MPAHGKLGADVKHDMSREKDAIFNGRTSKVYDRILISRTSQAHHLERAADAVSVTDGAASGGPGSAHPALGRQHARHGHGHGHGRTHRHERHVAQPHPHVRATAAVGVPDAAQHHTAATLHSL